jgi:hypothetical protein
MGSLVLIEKAGPDTTILLCSDHGFHPDHLRPAGLPDEPAGPAAEHRHHSIIARDTPICGSSLLDICPTVLALYGLPAGLDMDGKPLIQAFDRPVEVYYIDSWDSVEGESGMLPEAARRDPGAEQEALNQLSSSWATWSGPPTTPSRPSRTASARATTASRGCIFLREILASQHTMLERLAREAGVPRPWPRPSSVTSTWCNASSGADRRWRCCTCRAAV